VDKQVISLLYLKPDEAGIITAAAILNRNGIVAFPTETVYGLGARFDDERAIARIFEAKGRPVDNPLIAHIASEESLSLLVREWSALDVKLAKSFWPGPLTIIAPKQNAVSALVTAGLDTVGVRMPAHDLALSLIRAAGRPLVAPSANRSGKPSPTSAAHVREDLEDFIDAVLDGGSTEVGLESTVVQAVNGEILLFRPGAITAQMLEEATDAKVHRAGLGESAPPSPGMKYVHYSPRAKVYLIRDKHPLRLWDFALDLVEQGERVVVLAFDDTLSAGPGGLLCYSMGSRHDLSFAARNLYALFRSADKTGATVLLVEGMEESGLGQALMNRLHKAASKVVEG
jgi:L-threonylcarbamoyladenylate synthase